jgi:hypothetical protein
MVWIAQAFETGELVNQFSPFYCIAIKNTALQQDCPSTGARAAFAIWLGGRP